MQKWLALSFITGLLLAGCAPKTPPQEGTSGPSFSKSTMVAGVLPAKTTHHLL
ncbi:hypothetical protein [Deinococcus roseus]|uniref:Uncharacterized protein n=1 Tax=Deinococcus roseus TaxID=392414 RepID=A0ABQ2DAF2_9DEIO|nr:hypothetical protein [Deinococcus roseus]GGJ51274.1 hypothetical protein GCM10008938_41640 [Deinococcus roseus]